MPDEVWERFARDHEGAIRNSAPKEPSARARMVTERLRREEENAAAAARRNGGSRFKGAKRRREQVDPHRPEGWRTGPAWQETRRRATRRRQFLGGIGVLVALAMALFALNPDKALSWLSGGSGGGKAASGGGPTPLPPETGRPSGAPGKASADTPTLSRPFAGSPAEQYADGAKGIVVPEAAATGAMSKERVATVLELTKDFLIAANLEPATIRGDRPAAALALLDPQQDDVSTMVTTALDKPDREHDPLKLFSRFDKNEVRMVGETVKTRGRMTFKEDADGSVIIHTDYTFVYPLTKRAQDSQEVARTIVRRVLDISILDPARFKVTPGKLTFRSFNVDIGNSACNTYDGVLHPGFPSSRPEASEPTGPAVDPYDRSRDLEIGEGTSGKAGSSDRCGRVTRT
ncbi:hypothetical protein [Streptomyces olivoreticuli]|uniref:hypothetical protein n=1 Tax=Streptomyces olivoreticuli TaxID=68246 RepID=UPI001F086C91|nr:hypothetical protein [Streptomyces olivoreticuli]